MAENFKEINILVVENEDPVGDLIETVLGTVDSRHIYKARNAQHGLVLFQSIKHDLIIVDLHIKPEDGIEFIKTIRDPDSPYAFKDVPVILMASYARPEEIREAETAGINELLVKPFSFDDLARRVSYAMNQHQNKKSI